MIENKNKKRANHGEFLQGGEPPLIGRARSSQKTSPFYDLYFGISPPLPFQGISFPTFFQSFFKHFVVENLLRVISHYYFNYISNVYFFLIY